MPLAYYSMSHWVMLPCSLSCQIQNSFQTMQGRSRTCLCAGWAYALPLALMGIPVFLFESFLWTLIIYWITDMNDNAGRCSTC